MALYEGFKATTPWRAFILNALVSSIIIVLALYIKGALDTYTIKHSKNSLKSVVTHDTSIKSVGITFAVTFLSSIGAYALMYFTLGFGGGMLVSTSSSDK